MYIIGIDSCIYVHGKENNLAENLPTLQIHEKPVTTMMTL